MTPDHHDLVLAITSHLPHLIAYTIVGTADELAQVTSSEVIKFSAGGFRDFTRIAASDPVMWRDVFLANKDAVLEMLGTFNEDLSKLTRAIRRGDGEALFEHFTRTRAIRRGIVEIGQDSAAPDFGRPHAQLGKRSNSPSSSLRKQGPITTGLGGCAKAVEQRLSPQAPRSMGPGSRFAWPGRRMDCIAACAPRSDVQIMTSRSRRVFRARFACSIPALFESEGAGNAGRPMRPIAACAMSSEIAHTR